MNNDIITGVVVGLSVALITWIATQLVKKKEKPFSKEEKIALKRLLNRLDTWNFHIYHSEELEEGTYTYLSIETLGNNEAVQKLLDRPVCFINLFPHYELGNLAKDKFLPSTIKNKYPFLLALYGATPTLPDNAVYIYEEDTEHENLIRYRYYPDTFPTLREFVNALRDLKEDLYRIAKIDY